MYVAVHSTGDNVTDMEMYSSSQQPSEKSPYSNVDLCFDINDAIRGIIIYVDPIILVFGIFGNSLLCIALTKDTTTNKANTVLMLALAIADLFACIIPGIEFLGINIYFRNPTKRWTQIRIMFYRFVHPLWIVALISSTYFTVALAIMRYIAVCRPFDAIKIGNMKFAKQCIGCVLILSSTGLIWYGNWGGTTFKLLWGEDLLNVWTRGPFHRATILGTVYHNGYLLIIRMVIPLIILSFTSIQLIRALHSARIMRASMSKEEDANQVAMANAENHCLNVSWQLSYCY